MKTRSLAGLVVLATLSMVGCGADGSNVSGIDTAAPQAPRLLNGYSKAAGTVVLLWAPNNESDLAGYHVYQVGVAAPVAVVGPNQRAAVLEHWIADEAPYRLTAIDHAGNESAPSATVVVKVGTTAVPEPADLIDLDR
jgi:hypothetical protein